MPLPFSFSTQRQTIEGEMPPVTGAVAVAEKIMGFGPGQVSTEPLLAIPSGHYAPALENAPPAAGQYLLGSHLPPAPSPNQRPREPFQAFISPPSATLQLSTPPHQTAAREAAAVEQDWTGQVEQVRNDVFGIAMSVSALTDRLDRLEQRLPHGSQSADARISALRSEIENWLANHLNSAIEHCLHRHLSHISSSATPVIDPPQP